MSITACILVKDEPELLKGCLEHLKEYISEFIIIDSSFNSKCKDVALDFRAQVISFNHIHPEKINSYSESLKRNLYLDAAKTDWVLTLDCDERIHSNDLKKINTLIEKYQSQKEILGFTLSRYEYIGEGKWAFNRQIPRLIRNDSEIRYNNVNIHTSILPSVKRLGGVIIDSGIAIHHFDNLIYNRAAKKRRVYRNELHKELLREELTEAELSDVTLFLGLEYAVIGEKDMAEALYNQSIKLDASNNFLANLFLSQLYLQDKKLTEIKKILDEETSNEAVLTILAEVALLEGNKDKALVLSLKSLKNNKASAHSCLNIASIVEDSNPLLALEFLYSALQINPYITDPIIYKKGDRPNLFEGQCSFLHSVRTFSSHVENCLDQLKSNEEREKWNRLLFVNNQQLIKSEKKLK